MTDLMVIERQGVRVLTTAQLAECYGTDTNTVKVNFNRNKDRYEEGKHYLCLKGAELQAFKNDVTNCNLVGNRASALYLWTERGALLHAKSLNTDKAWEVYGELVETYFRAKKAETALQNLSPQLQLMIKFETEQNALKSRVTELERRVEDMTAPEPEPEPERLPFTPEPKKWSEREKDYLRRAYALGQTDVEIAAELGRTVDSIHNKRRVLGLVQVTRPHWSKDEDKKLKRLLNKGLTAPEISALIGRSADGVLSRKSKLRRKGVKI
jgi:DNA-binding CsgD family transcriptional regulator